MDADIQPLPLLSRGKHRNPRRGACFMELASYLAGERWSDKPRCTHPLLAHLARLVNDLTNDAHRPQLAMLVPSVIGLNSTDPLWNDELTLLVAGRAMPLVAEDDQRALGVGILSCEKHRSRRAGVPDLPLHQASRRAFEQVPLAAAWAREFVAEYGPTGRKHPGSAVIEIAAIALARAPVQDRASTLRELLIDAITLCEQLAGREQSVRAAPDPAQWRSIVAVAPSR